MPYNLNTQRHYYLWCYCILDKYLVKCFWVVLWCPGYYTCIPFLAVLISKQTTACPKWFILTLYEPEISLHVEMTF
jgi:hypothetical protein